MKKLLHWVFQWLLSAELESLKEEIKAVTLTKESLKVLQGQNKNLLEQQKKYVAHLQNTVADISVDVDVNRPDFHDSSWAVISIKGYQSQYLKFINLRDADIREITSFLSRFDHGHIRYDAPPETAKFIKSDLYRKH